MATGFRRIVFFVDGRKFVAQVFAADQRLLIEAAAANGLSLDAYIKTSGSVENALALARKNR